MLIRNDANLRLVIYPKIGKQDYELIGKVNAKRKCNN
ncbi:Uncharacterised protein [Orientia tsutsugamushi]|nr:hypothetical protein OTSTA763_2014 [Orientia tsutsugamushi str. TA763]KJV72530.1 hypothetical protein OTSTA763_1935 [Orientia tsutsugamushi str. TA763]KJV74170.1 hypothetical protein OTSTA763_1241 [Orientia tsutsugamushi str. TA763]SPP25071.1 Uncharacterised protein [Orientia tsutsugamushi]SPP26276.1 Uncharacterised protein [Orientia tsutsugamushi]